MSKLTAQTLILLACIAGIVTLAVHRVDGWGWLVFIAILTALS